MRVLMRGQKGRSICGKTVCRRICCRGAGVSLDQFKVEVVTGQIEADPGKTKTGSCEACFTSRLRSATAVADSCHRRCRIHEFELLPGLRGLGHRVRANRYGGALSEYGDPLHEWGGFAGR